MSENKMSNYEKVGQFNKNFEVIEHKIPQTNIIKTNLETILQRRSLIKEEYDEFNHSIEREINNEQIYDSNGLKRKNGNFVEMVDGLIDMLYVIYGFGRYIGVDLDKGFDIVHKSNMSKLCKSKEEAIKTVEWYKNKKNENDQYVYDTPTYRKSKCGNYWIVYNESTNKILKSINYKPATSGLEKLCDPPMMACGINLMNLAQYYSD